MSLTTVAEIRKNIKHPIVDCDGHWREWQPVFEEYIREIGGNGIADDYLKAKGKRSVQDNWYTASPEERHNKRLRRSTAWGNPSQSVLNYGTTKLPRLMRSRLDDLGIDFSIIYPTSAMGIIGIRNEAMRKAATRAFNTMTADIFSEMKDRFAPVAFISNHSVQEAIDEVTHIRKELGMRAIVMHVSLLKKQKEGQGFYVDTLGLDSDENWDPFWQTCVDLGVAVTTHGGALSWPDHASTTNFTYNHIGHFAQANQAAAKAVFLGGVTRRFPNLNFAFLEGGAGWASNLLLDLVGHWEKRNVETMEQFLRPDLLDVKGFGDLINEWGDERMKKVGVSEVITNVIQGGVPTLEELTTRERPYYDDYSAIQVKSKQELRDLYSANFYFGCEADDKTTAWAFDKRLKTRLNPVFSSDLSHWDALVMEETVPEAHELLEDGWLDEHDWKDFMFGNAVRLHGGMNPDFFKGTPIEAEVAKELAKGKVSVRA
jgi:predicted TIM-barrel fold metal-dependent hydrolase